MWAWAAGRVFIHILEYQNSNMLKAVPAFANTILPYKFDFHNRRMHRLAIKNSI
jgi:hypothetical protein